MTDFTLPRLKTGKRGAGCKNAKKGGGGGGYHSELEIKVPTELGFKLSFIPIFHFPFPRARSPF